MLKQGPSELPEAHYEYKLNISLRRVGGELDFKKKKKKAKEKGAGGGERLEKRHLKETKDEAGF